MNEQDAGEAKNKVNQVGPKGSGSWVSDLIPAYLEHVRIEHDRAAISIERYRARLRRFIDEVGDCQVSRITPDKLTLYKRRLMDAGLSPATIGGLFSCMRGFLRYVRDVRGLKVLDAETIKRPRIPSRSVDYLTKDEVERLVAAIPIRTWSGLRDLALIEVLFSSGMRIAEVLALDRGQIDWQLREAQIVGKGNKARKVYFSKRAMDCLRRYLETRHDEDPALFIRNGLTPKRLEAHGTWRRFNRYGQLAGLGKRVYPHMLRHTMATTLLANGCPIGHIRVLLGHTHLTTTCRYYLGMMSDAEAKAAHDKYLYTEKKVIDDEDERYGNVI